MIPNDLILSPQHGAALARLKHVSGFSTTLTRNGDERASVFNRLDHIERVLLVNRMLCRSGGVDSAASDRGVVLHDLNRWAFAHNSEYGFYSQEEALEPYLRLVIPEITDEELADLRRFHRKEISGMRAPARPTLAADLLAGVIEDPILLISGLNVNMDAVPGFLRETLFSDLPDQGRRRLRELCACLNVDRDIARFRVAFSDFFAERAGKMIQRYASEANSFDDLLERIVRDFRKIRMVDSRQFFYINNELVCHRSSIQSLVGALVERYGYRSMCERLLTLDEPGLVSFLREQGMTDAELEPLYPTLDYTNQAGSAVACLLRLR